MQSLSAAHDTNNPDLPSRRLAGNSLGGHYTAQGNFVPDLSGVTALAEALKQNSTLTALGYALSSLMTDLIKCQQPLTAAQLSALRSQPRRQRTRRRGR